MEAEDNDGMAIAVGYSDICREEGFPDYLSPAGGHRREKKQCNFSGLEGGGERKKCSEKHFYNATLIFRERRGHGVLF